MSEDSFESLRAQVEKWSKECYRLRKQVRELKKAVDVYAAGDQRKEAELALSQYYALERESMRQPDVNRDVLKALEDGQWKDPTQIAVELRLTFWEVNRALLEKLKDKVERKTATLELKHPVFRIAKAQRTRRED